MDSVATLVLRPARAEDAPALARLRDEAIRAACAGRASPHQMRAWRRTPDAVVPVITQRMVRAATRRDDYAVALSDEVLAGFCLTSPAGPAGYVDAIYIHPRYWRRGIGRALLERAEQVMAGQGARHMRLESVMWAVGFYERLGYVRRGPASDTDDGAATPVMEMDKTL